MRKATNKADSRGVTSEYDHQGDESRGAAIARRYDALGLTDRKWHEETGIAPPTLKRAMADDSRVRAGTYAAIESNLARLEARNAGKPTVTPRGVIEDEHGGIVRIRLEGVFGAEAAIVEAPADNPDALAAALDIIMRKMNQPPADGE